ncbi:hypothetical protein JCM1840_002202 [Sporobolomyces johnsonii]
MSSSASSSPFPPALPSSSAAPSSAAVDEEDLLALLGSDTFSLESRRDKDLLVLQSFLQGVLPPAPSQQLSPSGISIGSSAPAPPSWNNGWRPDASTSAAPYGSPMSFQSTSSGSAAVPPAPSSSLNNHPSPAFPPNLAAAVLPLNFFPDPFAGASAGTSPPSLAGVPGGTSGALSGAAISGGGAATPASSPRRRGTGGAERGDRTSSAKGSFGPGAGAATAVEEEAQGWKSRLRNSTRARRLDEEQAPRGYQLQQDEDAMME